MIDTAIILAAGRGSRLKEITAHRSKALAPIAGKPIIERVIDSLRGAGITRFIIVGAPHDKALEAFTSTLPSATFLVQDSPLGSGDALKRCEHVSPDTFLVCACDSLVPLSDIKRLIDNHSATNAATLSIIEVPADVSLSARSVVTMEGDRITDIIEKPTPSERVSNLSSLPLYILTKEIFEEVASLPPSPRGEYELPAALRSLMKRGRTIKGVRATERHDLTDQQDLLEMNMRLLADITPHVQVHASVTIPSSVTLLPPVIIEGGVTIGEDAVIGPFVYLEQGVTVQSGARITRTVATRGALVSGNLTSKILT
jgi:bifunctional UDP-N-acetylglucosamine pyrophosphorylase/glucosamine-1-phosphate N-acetyltransferase